MTPIFIEIPSRIRSQHVDEVAVAMILYYNSAAVALFVPLATFPLPPRAETFRVVSRDIGEGPYQFVAKSLRAFDRGGS